MTKAEELKLLEQIAEIIDYAGPDTYIHDTFSGIVDICRNNIVNDFGDHPIADLESERKKNEDAGKMILKLEHENDALSGTIKAKDAEIEKLGHLLDAKVAECKKIAEERDVMTECHAGLAEMVDKYELEIQRLKAEVYDLRKWGESPVVPTAEGV